MSPHIIPLSHLSKHVKFIESHMAAVDLPHRLSCQLPQQPAIPPGQKLLPGPKLPQVQWECTPAPVASRGWVNRDSNWVNNYNIIQHTCIYIYTRMYVYVYSWLSWSNQFSWLVHLYSIPKNIKASTRTSATGFFERCFKKYQFPLC